MRTAQENGTREFLRFNRRSGVAERLVADAALELAPDGGRIQAWVDQHPIKADAGADSGEQGAFDVGLPREPRGHLAELARLEATGWWDRVREYEQLIDDEVGLVRAGSDLDLAIVVVRKNASRDEIKKVKRALDNLQLMYLDQIDGANRRKPLPAGVVRLVTVHSMRGLDADRVLLLDIEGLDDIPDHRPALLNIALSRARSGTRVVLKPAPAGPGSHRAFVEQLIDAYSASLEVSAPPQD